MFTLGDVPFALFKTTLGSYGENTVQLTEAASLKSTFSLLHSASLPALQVSCIPMSHLRTDLHLKACFPGNSKDGSAHLEI